MWKVPRGRVSDSGTEERNGKSRKTSVGGGRNRPKTGLFPGFHPRNTQGNRDRGLKKEFRKNPVGSSLEEREKGDMFIFRR